MFYYQIIFQYAIYFRCLCDVKTAVWVSIASGMSTRKDLEMLVENTGSVCLMFLFSTFNDCLDEFVKNLSVECGKMFTEDLRFCQRGVESQSIILFVPTFLPPSHIHSTAYSHP